MAATVFAVTVGGGTVLGLLRHLMARASANGGGWAFWVDLVIPGLGAIAAPVGIGRVAGSPVALCG